MLEVINDYEYSLKNFRKCQVNTPLYVVRKTWELVLKYKPFFNRVLDLGAGDARFAYGNFYGSYTGVEIDNSQINTEHGNSKVNIVEQCAFDFNESDFDLCIGNPPYVRHHFIDKKWQKKCGGFLSDHMGVKFDHRANLYIYFLALSLLKTSDKGLVASIVPFEWVSRPSAKPVRDFIEKHGWNVRVYRFSSDIFKEERVLTTASISIIDKSGTNSNWEFYKIDKNLQAIKTSTPTGEDENVLSYTSRTGSLYAHRGLSPGSQKIFCLTEEERLFHGLEIERDVVPCITSMKDLSNNDSILNMELFRSKYIYSGARCWLIRSDRKLTPSLMDYIASTPYEKRNTWTCNHRQFWWKYLFPQISDIIYSSGFVKHGPKVMINDVGAVVVGSAHGIVNKEALSNQYILEKIKEYNFESKVVSHSGILKKIEVNQMNTVLHEIKNMQANL